MLRDNAPDPGDLYQQFVGKLKIYLRIGYELIFFVVVWVGAFSTLVLKRDLMIMYEAARSGIPAAQITDRQNASSGKWAFTEGLEVMFLVVLFYLLWPLCFDAVARLPRLRACKSLSASWDRKTQPFRFSISGRSTRDLRPQVFGYWIARDGGTLLGWRSVLPGRIESCACGES